MASSMVIPQDIIDSIIEEVGNDTRLLKICSLVSSEFLLPCRKRLFSRISLMNDHDQRKSQRFHQLLVKNPVLQSFVKTLSISIHWGNSNYNSIISIFRLSFCSLECFSINWQRTSWNSLSSDLKDALSTIIRSPSLKSIQFDSIDVPILLFQGINLTMLELRAVPPHFDLSDRHSSLFAPPASGEGGKTASHTVIDQFEWIIDTPVPGLPNPMFLPFTCHLRVLNIYVYAYAPVISEFDILAFIIRSLQISSSSATLEHLVFGISFPSKHHADHLALLDNLSDADVWNHLDSAVTHPTGSRLQSVEIDIDYYFYDDEDTMNSYESEVAGSVLNALPLLRKKDILSVRATNLYMHL